MANVRATVSTVILPGEKSRPSNNFPPKGEKVNC